MTATNGWDQHKLYVESTLERLDNNVKGIFKKLNSVDVRVSRLEVKNKLWWVALGATPAVIILAVKLLG